MSFHFFIWCAVSAKHQISKTYTFQYAHKNIIRRYSIFGDILFILARDHGVMEASALWQFHLNISELPIFTASWFYDTHITVAKHVDLFEYTSKFVRGVCLTWRSQYLTYKTNLHRVWCINLWKSWLNF